MAVIDVQVAASSDDGTEVNGSAPTLTGTTISFGGTASNALVCGARFTGITIPAGATINTAYMSAYFYNTGVDDVNATIYGEDNGSPGTFTTSDGDIDGRTLTTASVNWTQTDVLGGGAAAWVQSPSLVSIIEELVASYAPYSSGAIALLWVPATSQAESGTARSYDQTGNVYGPKLYIEYTEGGEEYTQTVSGSLVAAGAMHRQPGKAAGGSLPQAGAVLRSIGKGAGGTLSTAGGIARLIARTISGALSSSSGLETTGGGAVTYTDGYGGDTFTEQDVMLISVAGPEVNFGTHPVYDVSTSRVFLQRFILDGIPAGATCLSATLHYFKASTVPNDAVTCTIYEISDANGDWIPGDNYGSTADAGEPCWNYKEYNTVGWAGSAGLSTSGTDYEATALGSFVIPASAVTGDHYTCAIDTDTVAAWFGQSTNNGIIMRCSGNAEYIGSAENTNASYRPYLVVEYIESGLVSQALAGVLSSAGNLARQVNKAAAGTLDWIGATAKGAQKTLAGALSSAGGLVGDKLSGTAAIVLEGTLTLAGGFAKQTQKIMGGSVGLVGEITRRIGKLIAAGMSFIGGLGRAKAGLSTPEWRTLLLENEDRRGLLEAEDRTIQVEED